MLCEAFENVRCFQLLVSLKHNQKRVLVDGQGPLRAFHTIGKETATAAWSIPDADTVASACRLCRAWGEAPLKRTGKWKASGRRR